MNIIDNSGTGLAALGRDEDRFIAHVAPGEMVVPPVISDNTRAIIRKEMAAVGLDPNQYEVGQGMSINPITGQAEFGFLKKIAKSVKKVVKKVAPIAAVIPGPWQPFAAVYQKGAAALKLAKGEGGLGEIMTLAAGGNQSVFGKSGALDKITSGDFANVGGGFKSALGNIGQVAKLDAAGNVMTDASGKLITEFKPLAYGSNILQSKASDLKQGFGGLLGGNVGKFNPITGQMQYLDAAGNITTDISKVAAQGFNPLQGISPMSNMPSEVFVDASGNAISKDAFDKLPAADQAKYSGKLVPQSSAISRAVTGSPSGTATAEQVASTQGPFREFLDDQLGFDPSGESGIYKFLPGGGGGGGGMGGGLALAGLAALYGKVVKDAAKKTEGGLTDIRQSVRPDLAPAPVFKGFDLGVRKQAAFGGPIGFGRQYFNEGGMAVKELDMRQGGESAGPGSGTSDDIPAMLSDGEFVMTAAANNGAGGFKFNKTKKGIELIAASKPNREKGVDVMTNLMETFEKYNKSGSMA